LYFSQTLESLLQEEIEPSRVGVRASAPQLPHSPQRGDSFVILLLSHNLQSYHHNHNLLRKNQTTLLVKCQQLETLEFLDPS
jgi:hypothetical protein